MKRVNVILGQYDPAKHSDRERLDTGPDTMVQQQFREEVDINTIVRRFGLTGDMPVFGREPMFGDFTEIHDFESAVEKVDKIRESFMTLAPEVRERFQNDPLRMYKAVLQAKDEKSAADLVSYEAPKEEAPKSDPPAEGSS